MRRRDLLGGTAALVGLGLTRQAWAQDFPEDACDTLPVPAEGPPFRQLPVVESVGGALRTTLSMTTLPVTVGGIDMLMAAYNGTFPGTLYRLKPGDRLQWNLVNRLDLIGLPPDSDQPSDKTKMLVDTNIHTHGLQVDPGPGGDDVLTKVSPGETKCYTYDIPGPGTDRAQPAGLYWYHPHKHGSTSHQGWQGLAGPIVIEGDIDKVPEVAAARERVLVLNELLFNPKGETPSAPIVPVAGFVPFTSEPSMPLDIRFPVNGVLTPDIGIRPGETQRWRVLAAGPHRFFRLKIDGHDMWQIAQDGIPFDRARRVNEIVLAPGNRAEFIIRGGSRGRYGVRAVCADQGHPGGPRPEVMLATLVSDGDPMDGALPEELVPAPVIPPDAPRGLDRTVVFSGNVATRPVEFFLDGKKFDPNIVDQQVVAGTVEEWTLINKDVFRHPFHIHVNPFQVIEVNGDPVTDPIWWDTFALPSMGSAKVRMYFRPDVTGRTVYHCHILPHEDNGMMALMQINPGPSSPPRRDLPLTCEVPE